MSETAPEPTQDSDTTEGEDTQTLTPADTADEKDWKAEADKWKALARKHEGTAKSNSQAAKRLTEIEESQKTEQQKLTERAEAAEKRAAEIELRAVRAEVAAAKGVPASLLYGASQEELEESADALLKFRGEKPKPDFGGGARGKDVAGTAQLTRDDVQRLTKAGKYEEIEKAREDGRLDDLMAGKQQG